MAIDLAQTLSLSFVGNTVQQYLWALLVFVIAFTVLRIFKAVVIRELKAFCEWTASQKCVRSGLAVIGSTHP